jgi:hypothetical protein
MMKRYNISFQKDIKQSVDLAEHILMTIEAESNREARKKFSESNGTETIM